MALVVASGLGLGCGSSRPPQAAAPEEHDAQVPEPVAEPIQNSSASQDVASRRPLSSTASYEEALAQPEPLNAQDERAHLTDLQLTGPMREVVGKCGVPKRAKVMIKVAVQNGRAIGVSVLVAFEKPKAPARPQTRAAAKLEAKTTARVTECLDRTVRALSWPPNPRRDSFTTEF